MPIFNSLTFAGVNSLDFGIYITGEAVYNAPTRSVEAVAIPGRDGDLIIDNGRFENIEVTYPAGTFGDDQTSFAERVRNFRNAVASKRGYQRLTDTYNPSEYRLGLFVNGIEVEPVGHGRAGEFELVFNCKPFRYLTSGETAITITSPAELTNPTLFDSMPLLAVDGYGDIQLGDYSISIVDGTLGDYLLQNSWVGYGDNDPTTTLALQDRISVAGLVNDGDDITATMTATFTISTTGSQVYSLGNPTNVSVTDGTSAVTDVTVTAKALSRGTVEITATYNMAYEYGAATNRVERIIEFSLTPLDQDKSKAWGTLRFNVVAVWFATNATGDRLALITDMSNIQGTPGIGQSFANNYVITKHTVLITDVRANSTVQYLGSPTYIDCDLGEAYKIVDGELISLNSYIDLGSDLPVLAPGTNEISYSGDITNLAITPRWRLL